MTRHVRPTIGVFALGLLLVTGCGASASGGGDDGLTGDQNIAGVVRDADGPLANAAVVVYGDNTAQEVRSDENGRFALTVTTPDPYLLATADDHWGTLVRLRWTDGVQTDVELELTSDAVVAQIATELGRSVPETSRVFLADLYSTSNLNGVGVVLDALSDPPFTLDAEGAPLEQDSPVNGQQEAVLVFTNVDATAVDALPNVTGDVGCGGEFDTGAEFDGPFPLLEKTISRLNFFCG